MSNGLCFLFTINPAEETIATLHSLSFFLIDMKKMVYNFSKGKTVKIFSPRMIHETASQFY